MTQHSIYMCVISSVPAQPTAIILCTQSSISRAVKIASLNSYKCTAVVIGRLHGYKSASKFTVQLSPPGQPNEGVT